MKLVDDLSVIWKRWSVKILAAQAVLIGTYAGLVVSGLAPTIPEWIRWAVLIVLSLAALAAAPIQQSNLPKP